MEFSWWQSRTYISKTSLSKVVSLVKTWSCSIFYGCLLQLLEAYGHFLLDEFGPWEQLADLSERWEIYRFIKKQQSF